MRKYILLMLSVLTLVTACDYNDEHFKGLDDLVAPSDMKRMEYLLTNTDYATISNNSENKRIAENIGEATKQELEALKNRMYFSETLPAAIYLPVFLQQKWPTADNGSAIKIVNNHRADNLNYLNDFPTSVSYQVSANDYQSVWGNSEVNYFTPAKPFANSSQMILSSAFPEAENGEVKVVAYKYSNQEPTGFVDPVATSVNENFETATDRERIDLNGWVNFAESGDLYWEARKFSNNLYAQCSAFNFTGEAISWLISPKVNLAETTDPKLTFDVNIGFFNAYTLQVLISDNFDGSDPTNATWKDITSSFAFYYKDGSYTEFYSAGVADLSNYTDKPIYVAFKYSGNGASNKTTTYQIDNVMIGDHVAVNKIPIYTNDFSGGIEDWENISVTGTKLWKTSVFNEVYRAEYSAFNTTGEQEGWLISPTILIPATGTIQLSLIGAVGHYNSDCLSVLVSSDFDGDINTATWSDVTFSFSFPNTVGAYSPVVSFGAASLNRYLGKDVVIAFKYEGSVESNATTTYQIYDMFIENISISSSSGIGALKSSMATQEKYEIYRYTGSNWENYKHATILNESDYIAMGFKYFDSSISPDKYLPIYLSTNFPYALEEDKMAVVYFNGNATTLNSDEYTFEQGLWRKSIGAIEVVDQFVKNKGKWQWDPSTVIDLPPGRNNPFVASYFQAMNDWVWENIDQGELGLEKMGDGYVDFRGNADYYTGASAYENNIDLRVGKAREQYPAEYGPMTDDEIRALIKERFAFVMGEALSILHPEAELVEGVEVTYTINLGIYEGDRLAGVTHYLVYKVVGDGEFELLEEITPIKK